MTIITILIYLFFPVLIILFFQRSKIAQKVGTVMLAYFVGIVMALSGLFPMPNESTEMAKIQDWFMNITVPLAIPLILFSCNIKALPVKSIAKSLVFGIIAILLSVVSGYYLIDNLAQVPELNKIAGMLVGVYTGGTPNLASLKMMLDVDSHTYLLINSFDMAISFLYLIIVMSFGIKLCHKFLNRKGKSSEFAYTSASEFIDTDLPYSKIFSKENIFFTFCR